MACAHILTYGGIDTPRSRIRGDSQGQPLEGESAQSFILKGSVSDLLPTRSMVAELSRSIESMATFCKVFNSTVANCQVFHQFGRLS